MGYLGSERGQSVRIRAGRSELPFLVLAAVTTAGILAVTVHRHAFVMDDAYITFRYAEHLARGQGLVYNPGSPPVEGTTSLLWALVLAAGSAAGAAPATLAQALGVVSGGLVLTLLARASADAHGRWTLVAVPAPLGLALTRAFPAWCTSGLETMAFTAVVTWGAWATARASERGGGMGAMALAWSLAVLLRPEGLLFAGLALSLAAGSTLRRGAPTGPVLRAALAPLTTLLLSTLFRMAYYGDLVPNTARAKVTGLRVDQGLAWLQVADADLALLLWAPLALLPPLLRRRAVDLQLALGALAWLTYVIAIGGDRFEQRFLVPVLPALAWLAVEGGRIVLGGRLRWVGAGLAVALLAELASRGATRVPPLRHDVESVAFMRTFAARRLAQGQTLRALVDDGTLPADTRLCVGAAGALPYAAGLWTLDYFGLNDRDIALRPPSPGRRVIAHEKRATAADLVAHDVTMFDASGHMVARDRAEAAEAWRDTATKLRKTEGAAGVLRRVCHRAGDLWLVFATPQPPERHDAAFGHLPRCDADLEAPASNRSRHPAGGPG